VRFFYSSRQWGFRTLRGINRDSPCSSAFSFLRGKVHPHHRSKLSERHEESIRARANCRPVRKKCGEKRASNVGKKSGVSITMSSVMLTSLLKYWYIVSFSHGSVVNAGWDLRRFLVRRKIQLSVTLTIIILTIKTNLNIWEATNSLGILRILMEYWCLFNVDVNWRDVSSCGVEIELTILIYFHYYCVVISVSTIINLSFVFLFFRLF
jgi:hypothetical protein